MPNKWQSISRNKQNAKKEFGAPTLYTNAGAYAKVTQLRISNSPQVFVEYHLIFDEPHGWFAGKDTLVHNLDTKLVSDVRSFRLDLKNFQKEQQAIQEAEKSDEDRLVQLRFRQRTSVCSLISST